ncbi:hypothetical protein V6N12_020802 [Hibiscus sabdariffa]|uniref:Acid phosphatase/vanadium-dependent haloperoxidase-related protein n=1 Tax=Hibiscus sabdariffa TaxID=183260 RepID=A0ABR2CZ57_9ROSI
MSSSCVFTNYPLICAFIAFAIAQSTKFFTSCNLIPAPEIQHIYFLESWVTLILQAVILVRYKERRWDIKQLVGSGGMPSSHSSTVTALATAIGFQEGFGGSLFATALILACIVMYDATGVRLHAGRQAEVLNQIVYELPAEHPLAESRPLRELLGHTPPQVFAGGMLGIITSAAGYFIFQSAA